MTLFRPILCLLLCAIALVMTAIAAERYFGGETVAAYVWQGGAIVVAAVAELLILWPLKGTKK